jgi:hypothetical protein
MRTERTSGRDTATAPLGRPWADGPAPTANVVQASRLVRATASVVVARSVPSVKPRRTERSGKAGDRRKTANRRDLPKMWVFLNRGGQASRWKASAEPVTRITTNEPRFPVLKARREVCPPTVPERLTRLTPTRFPLRLDARANGSHPRSTPAEPARGGGSAPGVRDGPRTPGKGL